MLIEEALATCPLPPLKKKLDSHQWRSFNGMKGMIHSPKFGGEMALDFINDAIILF